MAAVDVQPPPTEPKPEVPDYLADPDAVLKDKDAKWRYGRAPDYSKTRNVYAETRQMNHAAGSLPQLVENLVKNWEVEASFKPELKDWRTIDHSNYTFAINGGPPQSAEHMLRVGTYNAIIAPNEFYSPENSDFASSHKTFKRMMPTFAWEVLEVYGGPPQVAFRWRHWGTMKNDYVGFNDKGERVTAKAHGGAIDIQGVTVAQVDDKVRLQKVETWFDPMEMFRQIAPNGVVNKVPIPKKVDYDAPKPTEEVVQQALPGPPKEEAPAHEEKVAQEEKLTQVEEPTQEERPSQGEQPASEAEMNVEVAATQVQTEGSRSSSSASSSWTKVSQPEEVSRPEGTSQTEVSQPQQSQHEKSHSEDSEPWESNLKDLKAEESTPDESPSDMAQTKESQSQKPQLEVSQPQGFQPQKSKPEGSNTEPKQSIYTSSVTGAEEPTARDVKTDNDVPKALDQVDDFLGQPAEEVHPHPNDMEKAVEPSAGDAVVAPPHSEEVRLTHEEMSRMTPMECPFLMNRE